MEAQCICPECQRMVHQLARHFHSSLHRLVDARHHQETPDTHSLWRQFVIVFVMKASKADRRVAWSTATPHKQWPPALGLHWQPYQIFTIIHNTTMFIEKNPCPTSMKSVLVDQRTGAQGPQNHQEPHFELGVWTVK